MKDSPHRYDNEQAIKHEIEDYCTAPHQAYNIAKGLSWRGFTTIDEVIGLTDEQLLNIRGIGVKGIEVIRTAHRCNGDKAERIRFQLARTKAYREEALAEIMKQQQRLAECNDLVKRWEQWLESHGKSVTDGDNA